VKLTAKVKLVADENERQALTDTLRQANSACDWISAQAWKTKTFGQYAIHKLVYAQARQRFHLSAQMIVRCIGKVADSYKLDKKRRRAFRTGGAICYDDRILSWNLKGTRVSIWTVSGRLRIGFEAGPKQMELLQSRQGETDLIWHHGGFYLAATCNVEEPEISDVDDFLGVDLGVANIASTSDGKAYSGSAIQSLRHRHRRLRKRLQKKQTRAAKRRLHKLAGREARFATDINHVISKQIVEEARRTRRAIVLEDLRHIRSRIRARRTQRAVLHSWAFAQLRAFLIYKAALVGVGVILVDPRDSSRECCQCGHIEKANRPSQSLFCCRCCGHTANADINAACVLAGRGRVNGPNVARASGAATSYQLSAGSG
jgi:putative transposase